MNAPDASGVNGSLIEISAMAEDPAQAMLIAPTWARISEQEINGLHNSQPETSLSLQQQTASAQETNEKSQEALAGVLAESQINEINRRIEEPGQLIEALQSKRQSAIAEWAETERLNLR